MNLEEYLEKKKDLYLCILDYLDTDNDLNESFKQLISIFDNQSIKKNQEDLTTLLHLIIQISNNHHRSPEFFTKIEKILIYFESEIQQFYSNHQIFNIFKNNKRILLFVIERKLLKLDESIVQTITSGNFRKANYPFYFYPEIKPFLTQNIPKISRNMSDINTEGFEFNRKNAENHHYICQLIRNDLIDDFIVYANKNNIPASAKIEKSIFETNNYLLSSKDVNLLEYSAFFGSLQIFKYLIKSKAKITGFVWLYAIHGRNPEIIHLLEDNQPQANPKLYEDCMNEAIKSQHNEIAQYFENNFLEDRKSLLKSVKCFNFEYMTNELVDSPVNFYYACRYDNPFLVKYMVNNNIENLNINSKYSSNFYEQTSLSAAIGEENREIAKFLLSMPNINVNIKSSTRSLNSFYGTFTISDNEEDDEDDDKDQRSSYVKIQNPLHAAIEQGDEEIVELLLSNPKINVNDVLEYHDDGQYGSYHVEKTALNLAIEKGYAKIVELLLKHNEIDVNRVCRHNDGIYGFPLGHDRYIDKIALIIAVEKENYEIVKLLLNHPKIDVNIMSRYHDYIYYGYQGFKGDEYQQRTALQIAVIKNNTEIIQLLLNHPKIEVNSHFISYRYQYKEANELKYKTDSYIHADSFDYDDDIFDFSDILIDDKQEKIGSYQIHRFRCYDSIDFCKLSDSNGEKEEKTPLFISVENKAVDSVKLLLNSPKIDVNCICTVFSNQGKLQKKSATNQAKQNNDVEIIKLLVDHKGVDILENTI